MATTISWPSKPKLDPRRVESMWGPGARLVRARSGRWVVALPNGRGWATTATPRGPTAQPPTERAGSGAEDVEYGYGEYPGMPKERFKPKAAPDAPTTPQPPTFTSAGMEAALSAIRQQISSLPGIYNPQRQNIFVGGQAQLGESGLDDVWRDANGNIVGYTTRVDTAGQPTPEGSQAYQLVGGLRGQAYRDAESGEAARFGGQGAYFGSARQDAQKQAAAQLNNSRTAFLRNMGQSQDQSFVSQGQQRTELGHALNEGQGNYADWREGQLGQWTANQMAAGASKVPEPTPSPQPGQQTQPVQPAKPAVPQQKNVRPVWEARPKYTPAQIKARFGNNAVLQQAGNKKWTVRYT